MEVVPLKMGEANFDGIFEKRLKKILYEDRDRTRQNETGQNEKKYRECEVNGFRDNESCNPLSFHC